MSERDDKIVAMMAYMREHWPSRVKKKWQVGEEDYSRMLGKVMNEWTTGKSKGKRFYRIAGQSGSGKTTQLLPMVEKWFELNNATPVLVAARKFPEYHPYIREITEEYGAENVRQMTDEVSTIMMFLTLQELIKNGYDIILDVTLLDPLVEGMLVNMLRAGKYVARMTMVTVSREISDGFIEKRKLGGDKKEAKRVVAKSTADEFWRVTDLAFEYYAENWPSMQVTLWSAWEMAPVYDGQIGNENAFQVLKKYHGIAELPEDAPSEKELLAAKMEWALGGGLGKK
ncbi:zeta toxin family protein [Candidatus Saccharibacteria bacterium]|nr:zeta toxin family protein [Candidatus Saccharibacteria bacterium]